MKKWRTMFPRGSFHRSWLKDDDPKTQVVTDGTSDTCGWTFARPIPYWTVQSRLRAAWDVLRGVADALYWEKP